MNNINKKENSNIRLANNNYIDTYRKYNSTYMNIPEKSVSDMLNEAFSKYRDNIAVSDGNRQLNYKELDKLSASFMNKLFSMGAEKGDIIGIKAEKNIDTIVAVMGILRGGFVYVPIHANYPEEKKKNIFLNCNCRLFADGTNVEELSGYNPNEKSDYIKNTPEKSLAYIIYTSGSTGVPKGVAISNHSVCNIIIDINNRFNINYNDKIIGLSALTFDLSVYDIIGALTCGAELFLVKNQRDIRSIIDCLRNEKITVWNSVPSIIEMAILATDDGEKFESVKNILLSGDTISVTLPEKIRKKFPNAEIYSLGGATEASIWSIYYPITDFSSNNKSVPYGYPLANQTITVRDKNMSLCPVGVSGEICIGGIGVAMGYINDDERTSASFVNTEEGIIYRTGDRGTFSPEGYVIFEGRLDRQVKINGYRIETGEIESAVLHNKNIISAVAFVYIDKNSNNKILALCYTAKEKLNENEVYNDLKSQLLDYMMPKIIMQIENIPLTANGKIDIEKLSETVSAMEEETDEEEFNDFEMKISNIWKKVLNVRKVNRKSDFFSCGGDSLKAMQFIDELKKENLISNDFKMTDFFVASDFNSLVKMIYDSTQQQTEIYEEEGEI